MKSLFNGTPAHDWTSMATISKGEYGVPAGLCFGYPCTVSGNAVSVVDGVALDAFGRAKFDLTLKELQEERDAVKELLPG